MPRSRRTSLFAALTLATVAAAAVVPLAHAATPRTAAVLAIPDPMAVGPDAVYQTDYDAGMSTLGGTTEGSAISQELDGDLFIPQGLTKPAPVIAFLHGRHATCELGAGTPIDDDGSLSPCPSADVTQPIDSFRGYDYMAKLLASDGYIVISMDANAINSYDAAAASQDGGAVAREQLIAKTLDTIASWNTTAGPTGVDSRLTGLVDMSRIGVMGHSRGGEGVNAFATYNQNRPATMADAMSVNGGLDYGPDYPGVKAIFALAPIDFNAQSPTGYAMGTLVPYCDGDVSNLAGTMPFEREVGANSNAGFPSVLYGVQGADHNYFNTVWQDGDDNAGDPDTYCGTAATTSDRLTTTQEMNIGTALITSFLRRYVGPEPAFDPIVTGAVHLPSDACPTSVVNPDATTQLTAPVPCAQEVQTSYSAPKSQREVLYTPGAKTDVPLALKGFTTTAACTPDTSGAGCPATATGTDTAYVDRSTTAQEHLVWDGPASLREDLTGVPDASRFGVLTLRMAASYVDTARNPALTTQDATVSLADALGHTATVKASDYAAGTLIPERTGNKGDNPEMVLGDIRVPLANFTGVDLTHLASLTVGFGTLTSKGNVDLAGLAFQEPGAPVTVVPPVAPSVPVTPTRPTTLTSAPVTIPDGFHPTRYATVATTTLGAGGHELGVAGHAGVPSTGASAVLVQLTLDHSPRAAHLTNAGGVTVASVTRGATTRTLALLPLTSNGTVALGSSGGPVRLTIKSIGYVAAGGDGFTASRLGRVSATLTPVTRAGRDLVVTVAGKSGISSSSLSAAVLLVRVTRASGAGTVLATTGGSAMTAVSSYAKSSGVDAVIVAVPDAHGQVHIRLSSGSAKVVVDQLGGYVSSLQKPLLQRVSGTQVIVSHVIAQRSTTFALGGLPKSVTQVLALVTVRNATAAGELLIAGSREGQVSVAHGADTTVLLPLTISNGHAELHLSTGRATVTVTPVGFTG